MNTKEIGEVAKKLIVLQHKLEETSMAELGADAWLFTADYAQSHYIEYFKGRVGAEDFYSAPFWVFGNAYYYPVYKLSQIVVYLQND